MGGEELIDQGRGDADQSRAVDAVLQAAEGRRRGQRGGLIGDGPGGGLQRRVGAEGQVVVEVLVAQGQGDDPLGEQGPLVVVDPCRVAGVGDGFVEGPEQPGRLADLAEQQGTGVGGEPAAEEVGDQGLGAEAGKGEGLAITVCHSGGLAARGW